MRFKLFSKPTVIKLGETVHAPSVSFDPNIPRRKTRREVTEIDEILADPQTRAEMAVPRNDAAQIHDLCTSGEWQHLNVHKLFSSAIQHGSAAVVAAMLEEDARLRDPEIAQYALVNSLQNIARNKDYYQQELADTADVLVVAGLLDKAAIEQILDHAMPYLETQDHHRVLEPHLQGLYSGEIVPTKESLAEKEIYLCLDRRARDAAARERAAEEEEARRANGIVTCEGRMHTQDYGPHAPSLTTSLVTADGRIVAPEPDKQL